MSQLGDLLRETADETTGSGRSMMLSLLDEDQVDGGDRALSKWTTLKRRLRFDWVGCCGGTGPTLILRESETPITEEDDDDDGNSVQNRVVELSESGLSSGSELACITRGTRNLAEALAEERLARGEHVTETSVAKVPLMKLLAETDGCDHSTTKWKGSDQICCVCMGREKGAAFIPCGHTFCRVCSREIWMDRGKCPLCNRLIFDILDLY